MRRPLQHHLDGVVLLRRRLRHHHCLHAVSAGTVRVAHSSRPLHHHILDRGPVLVRQMVPSETLIRRAVIRAGHGQR